MPRYTRKWHAGDAVAPGAWLEEIERHCRVVAIYADVEEPDWAALRNVATRASVEPWHRVSAFEDDGYATSDANFMAAASPATILALLNRAGL